jgi:hypothetical protein
MTPETISEASSLYKDLGAQGVIVLITICSFGFIVWLYKEQVKMLEKMAQAIQVQTASIMEQNKMLATHETASNAFRCNIIKAMENLATSVQQLTLLTLMKSNSTIDDLKGVVKHDNKSPK